MVKKEHPRLAKILYQKGKSDFECIELEPLEINEMDKPKVKDGENIINLISRVQIEQI